jgi:hypothetical protein
VIYVSFLSEGRILDVLNYKDYYASIESYFYQNAKDITIPVGLPTEIVDGIVDSDTIHDDVKGYVSAALKGEEYQFQTTGLRQNLTENIYTYFESENIEMTELQEETVPEYTQMIADEYEADMKVPLVSYMPKIKNLYRKVLAGILAATFLLGAAIVFVLLRMYHWKHKGLRYVAYSTTATALIVAVPGIVAQATGVYKRVGINAEHLYNAFVSYVQNGINMLFYTAIGWLVVTCALLFFISFLKKNGKRRL